MSLHCDRWDLLANIQNSFCTTLSTANHTQAFFCTKPKFCCTYFDSRDLLVNIQNSFCTTLSTTSKTQHFSALMQNSAAQFHSKILHKVQISKITLPLIQSCPNQILQVPNHVSIMSKPKSSLKPQQHKIQVSKTPQFNGFSRFEK